MGTDIVSWVIIICCIMMSAYFSATETAFSSLNRIRMKNMAEKGSKRAKLVLKLSENYDSLLSTILIGNNIVNITCTSLVTILCVKGFGEDVGATLSTVITTVVILVFGEVSPKSIAKESAETVAMLSAPLLRTFIYILSPANFLFRQWKKLLSCIFKSQDNKGITEEELLTIVQEAEADGGIDKEEGSLIRSAIEFNELEAIDILTPRVDVIGVSVALSKPEIGKVFAKTGYSRLPVYEKDMDNVVGILYHKDFYNYVNNSDMTIREAVKPVLFTTKHKNISELLKELQVKHMHIAVIVDEFGCTVGILTLEDILEELVGEIWDEHDEVVREVEPLSENVYRVSGKTNVERLFESLGYEQEFDVQTVSGWIMELLERIPEAGDTVDYRNMHLTVESMKEKRVDTVRLEIRPESQSA